MTKENAIEGEVVNDEPVKELTLSPETARAVEITPAELKKQVVTAKQMRKIITDFIKGQMAKGKDYGVIEMEKNGRKITSKPTLLKPGSEKFCSLFKIRPTFKKDTDTWEMLGKVPGVICYICELVNTKGEVLGEGRGSFKANMQNDFDINKAVKNAQKRAQVDAVLRTGNLSDFFTQDVEDMPKEARNNTSKAPAKSAGKPSPVSEAQAFMIKKLYLEMRGDYREYVDFDKMNSKQASDMIKELISNADDLDRQTRNDNLKYMESKLKIKVDFSKKTITKIEDKKEK